MLKLFLSLIIFNFLLIEPVNATALETKKILDSTNINHSVVNKIGTKTTSGSKIPLGSVITWFFDSDPTDNNCVSSKTGGDGSGGVCKWLECNGQAVSAEVYPDFVKNTSTDGKSFIPNYSGESIYHQKNTSYQRLDVRFIIRARSAFPKSADSHLDGISRINAGGFNTFSDHQIGYYGVELPENYLPEKEEWTSKLALENAFVSVRYLIRVSN